MLYHAFNIHNINHYHAFNIIKVISPATQTQMFLLFLCQANTPPIHTYMLPKDGQTQFTGLLLLLGPTSCN